MESPASLRSREECKLDETKQRQTPYETTRGCRYESALVPFGEVVMAKIADADKLRAGKLDSAWTKPV